MLSGSLIDLACTLSRYLEVFRREEIVIAKGTGLSLAEVRCLLEFIDESQLAVKELKKRLGLGNSQLSRILNRLEDAELITRRIDPSNRRCILAGITGKGSEFVRTLEDRVVKLCGPAFEAIPAESRETTVNVLKRVLEFLSRQSGSTSPQEAGTAPPANGKKNGKL